MSEKIQLLSTISVEKIVAAIHSTGYIIIPNALPTALFDVLYQRIRLLSASEELKQAKVGRSSIAKNITQIRGDKTYWLETNNDTDQQFLSTMDQLRLALNQRLFLGLFEYESHYAVYQPGSFYKKHSDVLAENSTSIMRSNNLSNKNRILSSVYYLNDNWDNHDGGELVLYNDKNSTLETIYPKKNNLVLFLSEQFPHEVKITTQTRYSITGWFRVNSD